MATDIFLGVPEDFSYGHTVYSHGWSDLPPFELDERDGPLGYVFADGIADRPLAVVISPQKKRIRIRVLGTERPDKRVREKIAAAGRRILRLDDDLSEFYQLARSTKELAWIARLKAGRLLRSPTVFEDLVKTICTTNCSWGLTKKMVSNLVESLGQPAADGGGRAFPTPEAMASMDEKFYREEIRAGYRAPYFAELAEQVAAGKIDPEGWLDSPLPTAELKKEMKRIKGVGDYAAENLLKLVGRYDGLALDSWIRAGFYKKHNGDKKCGDREISRYYERFGAWRGLAIWCDMTERWFA